MENPHPPNQPTSDSNWKHTTRKGVNNLISHSGNQFTIYPLWLNMGGQTGLSLDHYHVSGDTPLSLLDLVNGIFTCVSGVFLLIYNSLFQVNYEINFNISFELQLD